MALSERLKYLIAALNFKNVTAFEDKVNVSRKTFSKVIKEGTDTGCKNILKIWTNFPNVNLHWLLTGKGDMFIDITDEDKLYPQDIATHSLVAEDDDVIDKLKDEYIKDLKDYIKSLKIENEGHKNMIEMIKRGEVIFPVIDRE